MLLVDVDVFVCCWACRSLFFTERKASATKKMLSTAAAAAAAAAAVAEATADADADAAAANDDDDRKMTEARVT